MSDPINFLATFIPNEGEFFRVKLALEIAIDEVVTTSPVAFATNSPKPRRRSWS